MIGHSRRSRPVGSGPAQIVDAGRQADAATIPPLPDSVPLFDVRVEVDAYSKTTTYVPTVEMANVLGTADSFWQATARQAVLALLETRRSVCVDDLRGDGLVPEPVNPNAWGAVFSALANAGRIQFIAYRKSRRRSSHSRVVAVWARGPFYEAKTE